MREYYCVFDYGKKQVGIAKTKQSVIQGDSLYQKLQEEPVYI